MSWFDGIIPGLITAGATLLGGERANEANREMAQAQMDFQERMSSTAYQRSMEDMRRAGLNPILAYQKGGASTPSGASAVISDTVGPAVERGMATALQSRRMEADLKLLAAQEDQSRAAAARDRMQAGLLDAQVDNVHADTENKRLASGVLEQDVHVRRADVDVRRADIDLRRAQGNTELENMLLRRAQTETERANLQLRSQQYQTEVQQTRVLVERWQRARSQAERAEIEERFYSSWFGRVVANIGITFRELLPFFQGGNSARSMVDR